MELATYQIIEQPIPNCTVIFLGEKITTFHDLLYYKKGLLLKYNYPLWNNHDFYFYACIYLFLPY
jgi:hypothetical protein